MAAQALHLQPIHDEIARLVFGGDHCIDDMLIQVTAIQFVPRGSNLYFSSAPLYESQGNAQIA
jgi:hypothetical protein